MSSTPTSRKQAFNIDLSTISPLLTRSPRTPVSSSTASPKVQQLHTRLLAIIRRLVENYNTWQLGQEKGTRFCCQLENIKLKLLDQASTAAAKDDDSASVFSDELTTCHQRLQVVMEVFVDIVKNVSDSVNQLRALEKLQQGEDKDAVLCRTWSMRKFVAVAETLLEHFRAEFQRKQMVFQEICHRSNPRDVSLMASAWEYQRYVGKETKFLIKCLITECGLPELEGNA